MGKSNRRTKARRSLERRFRPELDRLELRLALSASTIASTPIDPSAALTTHVLSVVSVTPSNGSALPTSPTTFALTFDRPIDPFSLGNDDVELLHVASDGTTSPLQPGEALTSESLDQSDPNGRKLIVELSKKLVDGQYELILNPSAQIQGEDGSSPSPVSQARVLAGFSIGVASMGTTSAVDIPSVGPVEENIAGVLDLADDPSRVQYYKFNLGTGHHWLLGLEVEGHLDGANLDSTVSLFDSKGRLISTSSQGLPDALSDPYLFAGLDAGTYYVGISAQKNVPDATGAYHPSLTSIDPTLEGGSFRLDIVADPADQPTQVLGAQLDHADPASTAPTGVTLQFSGAIDATKLRAAGMPALKLVDELGATWPVSTLAYDASNGQLSLLFDRPLSPGTYSLETTGVASFTDLAGRQPIAPGLASGVIDTFVVGQSTTESDDLGVVLPSGLASTLEISPDRSTVERFVVINPGLHAIEGITAASAVSFSVEDSSGQVLATGPAGSSGDSTEVNLPAGSYQIVFHTTKLQGSEISLVIRQLEGQASSFLDLGVSQGPALNLRLVSPQVGFGGFANSTAISPAPTMSLGVATAGTPTLSDANRPEATGRTSGSPTSTSSGVVTPVGASVAGFLAFVPPAGQLSASANQVGTVASSGSSSIAAVAANGGLPVGLIVVPETGSGEDNLEPEAAAIDRSVREPMAASPRGGASTAEGVLARAPSSRLADDRTLEQADWAGRLFDKALSWFRTLPSPLEPESVEMGAVATSVPESRRAESGPLEDETRTMSASLGSPVLIGAGLGAIAYHYRRRLLGSRPARRVSSKGRPIAIGKPHPTLGGTHQLKRRSKSYSSRG